MDEQNFPNEAKILLTIPSFSLFITGGLCLLSHQEWQQEPSTFVAANQTAEFLTVTYEAVKKDTTNRLKPSDRKGVSTKMQYKGIGPDHFVPPLLHMEMGMVNQSWDCFEEWVDDVVEIFPPHEKKARKKLQIAKKSLLWQRAKEMKLKKQ
jgi:hypothetical protein